jgi:choline dehydrogenase-like flavoprotein
MLLDRIPLAPQLADPFEVFLTRWLPQPNFAKLFEKALSSDRLPYVLNATVVGMEFSGSRFTAVNVVDRTGVRTRITCAQDVLATGTIEAVRLMANVGTKSLDCPWRMNQNLGQYFQDHAVVRVGQVEVDDASAITRFSNILSHGKKYQPKIRLHTEKQAVSLCAFFSFDSSISEHLDILKQFLRALMGQKRLELNQRLPSRLIKLAGHLMPLIYAYAKNSRIYVPGNAKVSLNIQSELLKSNHRSLIIDTARQDEFGLHPIVFDWQIDGGEVDEIVDFSEALGEQLRTLGIGRLILEPDLTETGAARRKWFLSNLSDTHHHAGELIMGNDPASSCVDANLRVHEAHNVYVAGACTFPSSGYANTTLTALALTRRLAARLGAQE